MFASFGFETLTVPDLAPWLGLVIGLAFGALAERTGFCFRRAVTGPADTRRPALGIWMAALVAAILGTQAAVAAGLISFETHRLHGADLPWLAIPVGGGLFGAGMVLTRGCISRLVVLGGSGNLRALIVLTVFAIVAHSTLKSALAPLRSGLSAWSMPVGNHASLAALPGGAVVWPALLAAGAAALARRSGAPRGRLALAAALGLLVPAAWVGTGFVLFDDFDPVPLSGLSFTGPTSEALFWGVAATAIKPGFGMGLIGGVLAGAFAAARIGRRFRWQSFDSPAQAGRYLAGAALMGIGGAVAGGCTVGAGLAGIPTISLSAILTLTAIAAGARLTEAALNAPWSGEFAGSSARPGARQRA